MILVILKLKKHQIKFTQTDLNEFKFFFKGDLIQSETTGSCADQLNSQLNKRNCRYGKCEQIKNGTDFVCHCDEVISKEFIK